MSDQTVERVAQALYDRFYQRSQAVPWRNWSEIDDESATKFWRELAETALTASERPTTTTPESRGRIAYAAFCRANKERLSRPMFDQLDQLERDAWIKAANVIWDLATTGHASL